MAGAETLREYWTHEAHGGPTHFAGADEIAWGTPGDFDRCVALVSEHMPPDKARGYCNLRHHDALGYYPAQHARMENGKSVEAVSADAEDDDDEEETRIRVIGDGDTDHDGDGLFDADGDGDGAVAVRVGKGYNPSQQRVSSGNSNGGQFGSQGTPSQRQAAVIAAANAKPAKGGKKNKKGKKGKGKKGKKGKDSAAAAAAADRKQDAAERASIRQAIAKLRQELAALQAKKRTIQAQLTPKQQSTGTKKPAVAGAKPAKAPAAAPAKAPAKAGSTSKKPAASSSSSAKTQLSSQLAAVNSDISQVQQQISSLNGQLQSIKGWLEDPPDMVPVYTPFRNVLAKVGPRNPRDVPTGRFRTFQGEIQEAKQALAEGRMADVVDLLGSARALAQTSQQRLVLGELQAAIGRTQHVVPELTKC